MANVLVTGMSGTGKSTALVELGRRGFRVVDTDTRHELDATWPVDEVVDALAAIGREAVR